MNSEYVRVVDDKEEIPSPPSQPALVTGYKPDRFQAFAIEAIERGENVLVTAKTGSGKTFVGEYQIAKSLQRGGRIFYTTPIKSLSNQKFNDLKVLFPQASVGIMTGDIKFRPDAQIVVMTTEILRNLLFKKGTLTENVGITALMSIDNLDSVVFDEVHYINDPSRGHVWEETLILLPRQVKLILLSATLSSPYGFARWLGETKKVPIWLISTLWRAVPLEHRVKGGCFFDSKEVFRSDVYKSWVSGRGAQLVAHDKFKQKVKDERAAGTVGAIEGKDRPKSFEHEMNLCLGNLHEEKGLPCIVFVFSRVGCEKLAKKVEHTFLDSSDAATVSHIWDFHLNRYKDTLLHSPQAHTLKELAVRGIAYHHSGLLPFLKEILEILFSKGLVKVLFATETFAVGINMPTKTVIFTSLEKFTDGGMRLLKTSEYIQMAGRAGRRGKDDKGLVIYLPQKEPVTALELQGIVCGKSATFSSRLNFHYDFVLKVANGKEIDYQILIEKSYWKALRDEEMVALQKELCGLRKDLEKVSLDGSEREACKELGEIELLISQTQNAKKKAAQRQLVSWKEDHRDSVWNSILEKYKDALALEKKIQTVELNLSDIQKIDIPVIRRRQNLLQNFSYITEEGFLEAKGLLASEVAEGHSLLMVELFLRQSRTEEYLGLHDLLTTLSVFLGESEEKSIPISKLNCSPAVREELYNVYDDLEMYLNEEKNQGIQYDNEFWAFSTEWVEPVSEWLGGTISIAELASKYDLFEGNIQKALMKLAAIVEEFQSMAKIMEEVEWLKELEGCQQLILRGIVLAESLYLRL